MEWRLEVQAFLRTVCIKAKQSITCKLDTFVAGLDDAKATKKFSTMKLKAGNSSMRMVVTSGCL